MKMLNSALLMLSASIILSVLTFGSFHTAFADFQLSKPYVLDGGGFVIDDKTIENSFIELSFLPAEQVGSKIKMKINDGTIIFEGKDFLFKQFGADILREGRFLRLIGFAEDSQGEQISLRFFGKQLGKSTDEFVYELRGKLERSGEEFDLYYITRSGLEVAPQLIQTQPTESPETKQITEESKEEEKNNMMILGIVSSEVALKEVFRFTLRAYDESLNPLRDFNQRYGVIPGVNMTVKITNQQGEELWNFEGKTSATGFYQDSRMVPQDNRILGRYFVEMTADYEGKSSVTKNWGITIQKQGSAARTQSLDQIST